MRVHRSRLVVLSVFLAVSIGLVSVSRAQLDDAIEFALKSPAGGEPVSGRVVDLNGGKLTVETADGKSQTIPLNKLTGDSARSALVQWVGGCVVSITTEDTLGKEAGQGSGFVVNGGELILTNYHVIRGAGKILVTFRVGERTPVEAQCLLADRDNDIAFLKVAAPPAGLKGLEFAGKKAPSPGSPTWTIGHPRGLEDTVAWGNVNAVRTTDKLPDPFKTMLTADAKTTWIQTDAVLTNGSSGSPLLNATGQVIGMNSWVAGPNLGFAVGCEHMAKLVAQAAESSPQELPLEPGKNEPGMEWMCRDLATLNKEYTEASEKFAEEVKRLPANMRPSAAIGFANQYQQKFYNAGKDRPDTWAGYQSMYLTVALVNDSPPSQALATAALKEIAKHHVGRQDLGDLAMSLAGDEYENGRKFCSFLVKSSPHKQVQAISAYALGINTLMLLESSNDISLPTILSRRKLVSSIAAGIRKNYAKLELTRGRMRGFPADSLAESLDKQLEACPYGLPADEIVGIDMEGVTFKLSDYQGKVVMLDFFVNWCPYCVRMYPHEREMDQTLAGRPFAIVGVHCESQAILEELVKGGVVTWRCFADGVQGPIAQDWEIDGFPAIYLLDHNGIVRTHFASIENEKIDRMVAQLLSEAEAQTEGSTTQASTR